jgi:Arm DNA-binding domain
MLTDKQVRALRTEREHEDIFDGEGAIAGFGVRVWGRTGKKTFFLMYRMPEAGRTRDRKLRRLDLGHYGLQAPAISLAKARQRARASGPDSSSSSGHYSDAGHHPTQQVHIFMQCGYPGVMGDSSYH